MIHEVMVLDHSGPAFGMILYGAAIKLFIFSALIVRLAILSDLPSGRRWISRPGRPGDAGRSHPWSALWNRSCPLKIEFQRADLRWWRCLLVGEFLAIICGAGELVSGEGEW